MNYPSENPNEKLLQRAAAELRDSATPAGPPPELMEGTVAAMRAVGTFSPRRSRFIPAMLSLAAMVLVSLGIIYWMTLRGGDEIAFGQVMAQVERTHSLTAKLIAEPDSPNAQEKTARLSVLGHLGRVDGDDGTISITDDRTGEHLWLNPRDHIATRSVMKSDESDFYLQIHEIAQSAPTSIGEKIFAGRRLVGFSGTSDIVTGVIKLPVNVWVDPKTKLPVRVEFLRKPSVVDTVLDDIQFDVKLDEAQFDLHPPRDYAVTDEGGLTGAELAALPAVSPEQARLLVLKPGVGIGPVKFGDSREQLVAFLGTPANTAGDANFSYPALGLAVSMNSGQAPGVSQIKAADAAFSSSNIRTFPGTMDGGINIGSALAEVYTTLGQPESSDGDIGSVLELSYPRQGLSVVICREKVAEINLFRPYNAPNRPPINRPTTVPYEVVVKLPPTPPPAPSEEQAKALVLKPDAGIGNLKWGATRAQIVAALGEPQGIARFGPTEMLEYSGDGLTVYVDPADGLTMLNAHGPPLPSTRPANMRVFAGATDKQVHIGSTVGEIEAAYGKEYVIIPDHVVNHPEARWQDMVYPPLGLHVTIDQQTNLVRGLVLNSPNQRAVTIPIPTTIPANRATELIPTTLPNDTTQKIIVVPKP